MADTERLTSRIVQFRDERDWEQFHTPRHLATTHSVEAAELQELFLWRDEDEADARLQSDGRRTDARREIADVLIYALLFCHELGIDPGDAIEEKLQENAEKYPPEAARGRAVKYTELDGDDDGLD